ncbi:degenerin-like protein asic-2 [Parasteatoda tepidariorum]|uniref:degenerin-like protein asic-2 n=1 Tax=Parasteatoda tepidariorum TaxID=114398 RepID=UPI0039BD5492
MMRDSKIGLNTEVHHTTGNSDEKPRKLSYNGNSKGNITLFSLMTIFSDKSSFPAVSQIRKANATGQKCFWIFLLLVTLSSCIYEAYRFSRVYFNYPVLIDLNVESNGDKLFPAVTICNLNRMKNTYASCRNKPWKKCIEDKFPYSVGVYVKPYGRMLPESFLYGTWSDFAYFDEDYRLTAQNFLTDYAKLDADSRKCYGHLFHELFTECTFQSNPCSEKDFTYYQSLQFGNCYTFKGQSRQNKSENVIEPANELEMELNIEEQQYLSITKASGIRLVVHNQNELPHPEENGINVSPEFETDVAVTRVSHKRLPKPYRDGCREYDTEKDDAMEESV